MDYRNKKPIETIVEKGRHLLKKVHSSAITAVFYENKISDYGDLKLSLITEETNWGTVVDLIKFEGFYMFGG